MNLHYVRLGFLGMIIGLGVIGGLAYYFKSTSKSYVTEVTGKVLPNLGGAFKLVDQFGKERKDQDFRGKYMLIYFGYTFCPDVCPLGLQNISAALGKLKTDFDRIVPIFITIDPTRDTVENLRIYAENWHPSFVMLTGTQREIDAVVKAYKVYAVKAKPDGTMADYLMDHSALVYLIDPTGKFVDYFPHTTSPAEIQKILQKHFMGIN